MLTLDRLAGVKQVLLFITEDAPMALQALAAVGERVDGQTGAMDASTVEDRRDGNGSGREDKNGGGRMMDGL